MWRRHVQFPPPSHHVLRSTCMQLLPLVEMYCRWELQEDCSDLRALMLRFDSEHELRSHELGRSLLFMLHDDDVGLDIFPDHGLNIVRPNPFDDIRERLRAADSAIIGLQSQVQWHLNFFPTFAHMCKSTMTPIIFKLKHKSFSWLSIVLTIILLHCYMHQ